jgi:hypothetical protein
MSAGGKHADPGPVASEPRSARSHPILVSAVAAVLTADSALIAIIADPLMGGIFGAVVATLWLRYLWLRSQRDPNGEDLAAAGLRTVDRPGRRDDLERYRQVVPRNALSGGSAPAPSSSSTGRDARYRSMARPASR